MKYIPLKTLLCITAFMFAQQISQAQSATKWEAEANEIIKKIDGVNLSPDSNIQIVKQALLLYQKANDWQNEAKCFSRLSAYHYYNEDFAKAEKAAKKTISICKNHRDTTSHTYLSGLSNLSIFYYLRGFYQKAIAVNNHVIQAEKTKNSNSSVLSENYQNNASYYMAFGDYDEAISYFRKSIDAYQTHLAQSKKDNGLTYSRLAGCYIGIADCYLNKRWYQKAKSGYQKAMATLDLLPTKSEYIQQNYYNCYYQLAEIYLMEFHADSTLIFAQKARQLSDSYNLFNNAFSYQVMGKYYGQQGDKKKARRYFNQAVAAAIEEASGYQQFPQVAETIISRSEYLIQLGQYRQALEGYQQGLLKISLGFESSDIYTNPSVDQCIQKFQALELIYGKAATFFTLSQKDKTESNYLEYSWKCYQLATQLIQQIRKSYVSAGAKHLLSEKAIPIYEGAITVAAQLYKKTGQEQFLQEAFIFAESNKAITLLESMNDEIAKQFAGLPDSLLQKDQDLHTEMTFWLNKLSEDIDSLVEKKYQNNYFNTKETHKQLISQLEKDYPRYYELKYKSLNSSLAALQKHLAIQQQVAIEYFMGHQKGYIFLVEPQKVHLFPIENLEEVNTKVAQLNTLISTEPANANFEQDFRQFCNSSHALFQYLLEAPLAELSQPVKNLLIIPDDLLGYLPFEVLLTKKVVNASPDFRSEQLHYVLNHFNVSYHYSSSFLLQKWFSNKQTTKQNFIGFAPKFSDGMTSNTRNCDQIELYDLRCARQETQAISQLLDGENLENEAATAAIFKKSINHKIIHLATHACIDPVNNHRNEIFFTESSLNSLDLSQMKINADLVVLSACNTGAGKLIKGEGIMSLSRGFIQAGCASTLMSLWSVNDCATSDLMLLFYKNILEGDTKDFSLRQAKLDIIQNAQDPAAAHPYYWAPFITFGDNSPIQFNNKNTLLFRSAGILLLVLCVWKIYGFFFKKN